MYGVLYLCATPIGNLEDITLRALRVLKEVDVIACEDTRVSAKLLGYYDIHTRTISYHEHNKKNKGEKIVDLLLDGKNVAVITDAGMPGISDPGSDLIELCETHGISTTVLPGASAGITALVQSKLSQRRYVFEGFLSQKKKERIEALNELSNETRTMVLYEAPHHLRATLEDLYKYLGNRNIFIARELTKKFEEKESLSLLEAIEEYSNREPRGEYVLVIEGKSKIDIIEERLNEWKKIPIEDHMSKYLQEGMDKKSAMKMVAADRGITKREVYNELLKLEGKKDE